MNLNMKFISQIADIQSGITIRTKVTPDAEGDVRVIQMRDVNAKNGQIRPNPIKIKEEKIKGDGFLKTGDILFTAKGRNNLATLYLGQFDKAIAVSFFFIIRSTTNISSEYLTWFINSSLGQRQLTKAKEGTQIRSITKASLGNLKVLLPSLEDQIIIGNLYKLMRKDEQLTLDLLRMRQQVSKQKLENYVNKFLQL